ncbi:MAG: hypothetical protein HY812_12910 [Planctomycetes bacterium]|nr:hypothetical protein [Planctomycetota bacterium]
MDQDRQQRTGPERPTSPWKGRALYFLAGAAVAYGCWLLLLDGPRGLRGTAEWFPWAAAALVLLVRLIATTEHDILRPPRLCMVDDLMASERLLGMTREQVIDLLGLPCQDCFSGEAGDRDLHWYLGPALIPIDSQWLFLELGPDGKVCRQRLHED